jgi:hypothetical protein
MSAEHLAGPYREPVRLPPPAGDPLARHTIELELEEGERLLWAGQPPQGVRFSPSDIFVIPFSLVWGGFAIAWETIALVYGAPWFFVLVGVPFVVVGLNLMVGRFFIAARERARTFYGVTNRRALIVTNNRERKVQEVDLERQAQITLVTHSKGYGSIAFGGPVVAPEPGKNPGGWKPSKETIPMFERIPNGNDVYQLICDAQDEIREQRRIAEERRLVAPSNLREEEGGEEEEESRMDRELRA